ncbi:hypothetical protein BHM03_00046543 [Ensete ventricosum]|nr:hypothetical protein BHM03_00046543 [Ensete ventricosum]
MRNRMDNESEYGDAIFRVQDQEVTTYVATRRGRGIRCGRGKRRIATATTTWAARADERGGSSGMWRSNAGATVGGCCQSGTLRRRAGGWSPEDSVESAAMWRRRGVVGVACNVAKGQCRWQRQLGSYRRTMLGGEGTQQIEGAGGYISEGKEWLAILAKVGSGRWLSPCGCYSMTHPSNEGVQQRAQAAEEIRSGGRKQRSSRRQSYIVGRVERSNVRPGNW